MSNGKSLLSLEEAGIEEEEEEEGYNDGRSRGKERKEYCLTLDRVGRLSRLSE